MSEAARNLGTTHYDEPGTAGSTWRNPGAAGTDEYWHPATEDGRGMGLRAEPCANCGTENKVGKASKQAAGIAFRRGDVRNSLVQVIGPISQNVRTTSGRHEGVHVITAKGEAAEELSQAVDLVHYRPGVLKHCDVEVTRTQFLILHFIPFGPERHFDHLGIGRGHDVSAHHHRIDTETLTLVHNERQRADKRAFRAT